jgi:hypothetical protein
MEKGFIGVWRGIFWSDKKRTVVWKLPFGEDMIFRASLKNPMSRLTDVNNVSY